MTIWKRAWAVPLLAGGLVACGGDDEPNNPDAGVTPDSGVVANNVVIDSFTANPTTINAGDTAVLSWSTQNATGITINLEGGGQVHSSAEATGTFTTPALQTTSTFSLVAAGEGGPATRTVVVTVNPVTPDSVMINSFTASPNPAPTGGSTLLSWTVANGSKVRVLEGATELFMTDTAATVASGSFSAAVPNASHTFTLEATASSDGTTTTTRMVTVTTVQATGEMEPNDDPTKANPVDGLTTGEITAGDIDTFSITVAQGGWVRAEVSDGAGGCNFDSVLLFTDGGTDPITFDVSSGNPVGDGSYCAKLDPAFDPELTDLAGGTYYIQVLGYDDTVTGTYTLTVETGAPMCGNGIPEGMEECDDGNMVNGDGCDACVEVAVCGNGRVETGEGCDDGNTMDGDGCSSACLGETTNSVSGPPADQTFTDSISPPTQRDFYEVTVTTESYLFAETGVGTIGTCADMMGGGTDTVLYLLDASQQLIGSNDDGGPGLCSSIDPNRDDWARLMPGTYYLRVEQYGSMPTSDITSYQLQVRLVVPGGCGDGVREEMTEQCDDANTMTGDGCDASCQLELAGTVSPPSGNVTVTLDEMADNAPIIGVQITQAGQSIAATTTAMDGTSDCGMNTILQLVDPGVTTVLGQSNPMGCASIDQPAAAYAQNLAVGTYYLVAAPATGAGMGTVRINVTISDPGCGDSIVQMGEQCDDGNAMAGDGCDASCQLEGNFTSEVEPNNDQATATALTAMSGATVSAIGAIDTDDDVDWYRFEVPAGPAQNLTATTLVYPGSADAAINCPINATGVDTELTLYDSAGTQLDHNDDYVAFTTSGCSQIETAMALMPGTYYLAVQSYDNSSSFPFYVLDVALAP